MRRAPKPLPTNLKPDLWVVSVADDDDRQLTADEVKEAIRRGEITGETLVWRAGLRDWTPLSSFADLALVLAMSQGAVRRPSAAPAARPSASPPAEHPSAPQTAESGAGARVLEPPARMASAPPAAGARPAEAATRMAATPPGERIVHLEPGKPVLEDAHTQAKPLLDEEAISGLFGADVEPVPLSSGTLLSGREERKMAPGAGQTSQSSRPPAGAAAPTPGSVQEEDLDFGTDSAPVINDRRPAAAHAKPADRSVAATDAPRPAGMRGLTAPPVERGASADRKPTSPAPGLLTSLGANRTTWGVVGGLVVLGALVLWLMLRSSPEGAPVPTAAVPPSASVVEPPASVATNSEQPPPVAPEVSGTTTPESEPPAKSKTTATTKAPFAGSMPGKPAQLAGEAKSAAGAAFDTAAAAAAMQSAATAAAACRKGDDPPGMAMVIVTFAPTGRVTGANVSGKPYAGTATGNCIAAAMRRVTVPPFGGASVTVSKRVPVH